MLASVLSRAAACRALSSLTRAIRSSRVRDCRFRADGMTIASKISSASASTMCSAISPFRAMSAAVGLPSTAVTPPRLLVGDSGSFRSLDDVRENRSYDNDEGSPFGCSKELTRASLPASHSCKRPRMSAPMDSYCAIKDAPTSCSLASCVKLSSDSSRIRCILA